MDVQTRLDNNANPFILSGYGYSREPETLLQDAGRGAADLVQFTLMARIVASGKWVPFTSAVTVETGASVPQGIYLGADIAAADIVAGDVTGLVILIGGNLTYDDARLVIENSLTLATPIKASTAVDNVFVQRVSDFLENKGMYAESTVDIASYENS